MNGSSNLTSVPVHKNGGNDGTNTTNVRRIVKITKFTTEYSFIICSKI
jgi:hypothetical protein